MIAQYHILYVDDEPSLLEVGRIFLERYKDFTITTALNAPEAIQMLEQENFDAIISDYQMPGMNGIEFLIEVRTRFGSIPFILFTGRGREEVVIQAINNGADHYLQKGGEPVSQFAELGHKVRLAVQQRRAEASIRDHERREADILNFLPDPTFAIDTRGVVIAWNRAMEKMTGVSAAEMLGKGKYEYAIPFYHERRPGLIDLILHDDPTVAARYPTMKRNGETIVGESISSALFNGKRAKIWFTAAPLYNNLGVITGAIESIRDVTEIKRTEEELLKKNDELCASYEQITATEEELRANLDELSRQEQALRESDRRVRQKLESLLAPEDTTDSLDLGDLIDTETLLLLMTDITRLTGVITAILDTKGNVLVASGWQEICTRFHRANPVTAGFCTESDLHLANNLKQGEYVAYKCRNNLWDVVTPLYIGDKHMGNIFMGQFIYDDEVVDESIFIEQALKYGFDRDEYLAAYHRVPRISRERVDELMGYLVKLTSFISRLSYSNLKLARTVKERDDLLGYLHKSEDKFRTLVENIPQKIFIKDRDYRYVSSNEKFAQDFGIHADEIVGRSDTDLFSPEFAAKYHADDIRVMETGQTEEFEEIYRLEGRDIWIHTIKTVVRDKNGEITGVLGAFWDITERKRAEEALHLANRKLTLLSSLTRHDITNQLTVLMGYLAILRMELFDPGLDDAFLKISTTLQRISTMILFTREYEAIGVMAPVWQNIHSLVDTAAVQTPFGQVELKNDLPADLEVFADPLVVKVFYNLVDNSVRYGGKITIIRFSVQELGDDLVVVCEDDGEGIVPEEKEMIFEHGFGKNTGLGLSLSKEILDITGITIRETGEPGEGARFEMIVPRGGYRFESGTR
ncbi:PocR ligand-binding domain-containing protein [Methanosphaerula palustris]|uniref:histidine kinase n=1 Tax=Methanosphaerula palustris (strain ATCC BAA-1556 / DSM 19958 / E1-9c) TaxID=521011 RepID=B8GKS7_METPE|nr:PocR ligand-binding domain-containing protein [Methanosphaerula palustris]ACL17223.1 multi-sensor signal transduction histidine kinase [Methanosphaerula palustris E1-9c]